MSNRLVLVVLCAASILCGCQKEQGNGNIQDSSKAEPLSKMADLDYGVSIEELIKAFQEDYARAANQMGLSQNHDDLEYETRGASVGDGMLTIGLTNRLNLIVNKSPKLKMIWYAGYPEDNESFLQEMQIVLMAADQNISEEEAKTYVDELWTEAWENRNNNPSSVQKHLPSGVLYSFSINERGLISFQIAYQK